MARLSGVCDSHSINGSTSRSPGFFVTFVTFVHFAFRALCERAHARSEVAAVPKRIQLDAEHGARGKSGRGDPLLGDGRRARHLDAPLNRLAVAAADRLAGAERHAVNLPM